MCPFVLLLSVILGYLGFTSGGQVVKTASSILQTTSLRPLAASIIENVDFRFLFDPEMIDNVDEFYEWDEKFVTYNVTTCCGVKHNVSLGIFPKDGAVAEITQNATSELTFYDVSDGNGTFIAFGSFMVKGRRLGKTDLIIRLTDRNADPSEPGSTVIEGPHYSVIVLRKRRVVDDVFRYALITLACILYVGFGCTIDLNVIWRILKRPISPAIGFGCQFVLMPLLGFGISRMLSLSDELSFGLLAMSASPGGGSSNVWVSLLGGDLDLSLTMTTISTFGALGMMPMWMYFLGHYFVNPSRLTIPYGTIARSLLTIIVPTLVGLLIKRFIPKLARPITHFTRPFSGIFVIYILTFGTYVNIYMYIIMGTQPNVIIAAILLPLLGYGIAFTLAMLLKRSKKNAVAISIETGVQNASIPIIMLQGNFKQPEGDIAAVMPVATSLFTQFPIMFAWLGLIIYRRFNPKVEPEDSEKDEKAEMEIAEEVKPPQDAANGNVCVYDIMSQTRNAEKNGGIISNDNVNPAMGDSVRL